MCSEKPSSQSKWLSLAKWWYNTNFHLAIQTTPYEVVYGPLPSIHLPYLLRESSIVDRTLNAREVVIKILQFHLSRAQNHMSQQVEKHMGDRSFTIGDFVYLKLKPYRQHSIYHDIFHKLLPKFYGPFKVIDSIGKVV